MGECLLKTDSNLIWPGRESQAASSKADFINKVNIALKEIREANYWLRIIEESRINNSEKFVKLINESEELKKILATICKNARRNNNK